jgi:(p)ppGpp synthase/HD superfamily hydrolase
MDPRGSITSILLIISEEVVTPTDKKYHTEEIIIHTPIALSRDETALVEHARRIAEAAHAGQMDKAHLPYFESHVADVHRRVVAYGGDATEQIAALLHDVLEDTGVSESDLRKKGVPEDALVIVKLLTRDPGKPKTEYYERIR